MKVLEINFQEKQNGIEKRCFYYNKNIFQKKHWNIYLDRGGDERMNEKTEREKWREELKKEKQKRRNKPNGFQYFSLGFSVCALVVAIITKLQ